MAREKFRTLTEQMFYTLICFREECCGMDIMKKVAKMTCGRVNIGPGTLYNLIEQFSQEGLITETATYGRRKSYILTDKGGKALAEEYDRIMKQAEDYRKYIYADR